ncbi:hypothetical protein [Paenibacillus sp. PvR053]
MWFAKASQTNGPGDMRRGFIVVRLRQVARRVKLDKWQRVAKGCFLWGFMAIA